MADTTLKRKAENLGDVSNVDASFKKSRQSCGEENGFKRKSFGKYKPQYTERDAKLAKVYSDLASESKDVRIKAATDLVKHCEGLGEGLQEEEALTDFTKIHTRLVKGLCSSRKAARLGFFTALTEVLRLTVGDGRSTAVQEFLDLVANTTVPDAHAQGQEKRDYLIGRMSSYSSLINSEILFKAATPSSDYLATIEALCHAAQETHWLREECGLNLCTASRLLAKAKCDPEYATALINTLISNNLAKTPEGVAVWLTVKSSFPQLKLPQNVWPHQDPLYKKSLSGLANVFKQTNSAAAEGDSADSKTAKVGNRQLAPNFAWDHVLASFVGAEGSEGSKQKNFRQFWIEVVDNGFFAATASAERKSVGFQIFSKVIAGAPPWTLEAAFSPKLLKCLINQSAKSERYLNKAAKSLLDTIAARAKSDASSASVILAGLISDNGSINFDKVTGSKTLQTILQNAEETMLVQLIRHYTALLGAPKTAEDRAAHTIRQSVADQLLTLVRGRYTMPMENIAPLWLQEVLLSLAIYGYTSDATGNGTAGTPPFTTSTRDMLRARLSSCLTHILGTQIDHDSTLPAFVVKSIADIDPAMNEAWNQADPAVQATIKSGLNIVSELDSKALTAAGPKASTLRALKLLFCMSLIQAYAGETDAIEMLTELQECYSTLSGSSAHKDQAFGAVLEIILGFSSKSSALYRKMAEQVFAAITAEINEEALRSMLDVLAQDESIAGQQALFDQNGVEEEASEDGSGLEADDSEDASEEDDSDDDDDDDDDVELIDDPASADEPDASTSEPSDDEEEGDSASATSDADAQEIAAFEKLLAGTLKTNLPTTADDAASSTDGESMNDEEMMALEPSLAAIFAQRASLAPKSAKAEKRNAKETVVNFKNRVLDLLLIYVKQQPSNPLAVGLVSPLLSLVRTTGSKQVADKTAALLRAYFDAAKAKGLPGATGGLKEGECWDLLEAVHKEALLFASKVHAAACSRASLFSARLLLAMDGANVAHGKIIDVYATTQKRCVESRSKLPSAFWVDWINWSLTMGAA